MTMVTLPLTGLICSMGVEGGRQMLQMDQACWAVCPNDNMSSVMEPPMSLKFMLQGGG